MKIKFRSFLSAMIVAAIMCGFTSCDDDDDDVDIAAAVIGSYSGDGLYVFPYMPSGMAYEGLTVNVARHDDEKDDVDVTFEHSTLGRFTFEDVDVEQTSSGYTLDGDGVVLMSRARYNKPDTTYSATIKATIYSANDFDFVLSTPDVMGGSTVTIKPAVDTPAGNLAGDYAGMMQWNVNGQDYGDAFEANVEVIAVDAKTVSISVPAMSASERMSTEAFVITGVAYSTDLTGKITLKKTDYEVTASNGMVYRGSVISGAIAGGKLSVKFSLTPGAMPMPIVCTFEQK